jgi:arylsulfatase A-like enzyme
LFAISQQAPAFRPGDPGAGGDTTAQPRWLVWLAVGLWLGVVDGAVVLAIDAPAAGPFASRLATLLTSIVIDLLVVLALAAAAWPAAAWLSRVSPLSFYPLHGAATASGLIGAAGIILLKLHHSNQLAPPPFVPRAAALLTACALLALASGLILERAPRARARLARVAGAPIAWILAAPFIALACTTIGWHRTESAARPKVPSVVLVSIDTFRPDHSSAYGYSRDTTPHLAALASEGALFESAYAHSNWTLPSHASMLSGLDPLFHGVLRNGDVLGLDHTTLAEAFRARGYRTAAFVGTLPRGFVGARRNFDQGFERYQHHPHPPAGWRGLFARALHRLHVNRVRHQLGNATDQISAVERWLEATAAEPFFVFVHIYDVHGKAHRLPYDAPPPHRERFCREALRAVGGCSEDGQSCASAYLNEVTLKRRPPPNSLRLERIRCLYDGGVAYVDHELGRLIAALRELGVEQRAVVAVTADHGEAFFEHEHLLHRHLHEEVMRVPLVVKAPGARPGVRLGRPVRIMDVAPTLLELAGVAVPSGMQGVSLARAVHRGEEPPLLPVFAVGRETALRHGRWKLLLPRSPEATGLGMYDLRRDPGESDNLAGRTAAGPERELREIVRRWEQQGLRARQSMDPLPVVEISSEEREHLEALGYVGGG